MSEIAAGLPAHPASSMPPASAAASAGINEDKREGTGEGTCEGTSAGTCRDITGGITDDISADKRADMRADATGDISAAIIKVPDRTSRLIVRDMSVPFQIIFASVARRHWATRSRPRRG